MSKINLHSISNNFRERERERGGEGERKGRRSFNLLLFLSHNY